MDRSSLTQQTARRLYNMIAVEGRAAPGDKLPNELELSQALGVSRRTLTAQGLLEVRRGRGTFVAPRAGELDAFGFGRLDWARGQLRDLFELRSIFEPQAARLACRRATEEELADILARGAQVEACIRAGRDRAEADRAFHAAIVQATHNEFMMRLLPMINQAVEAALASGRRQDQLAEDTLRDHALVLDFFRRRDEAGAEHAMAVHMLHSIDVLELEP